MMGSRIRIKHSHGDGEALSRHYRRYHHFKAGSLRWWKRRWWKRMRRALKADAQNT